MTKDLSFNMPSGQKLWIVTGKGGTGKTTVAAALGIKAAEEGKKVLLVETHRLTHLGKLFGVGTVGYEATRVGPNLSLLQINQEDAFEEYVLQQVRFKFLYDTVFNNRFVRHFIDGAPGLAELLTIGKIWALVEEKGSKSGKNAYDLVIVDAPSTGHGLSLLTISQVVVDAVRVGPLHSKAKAILDLLRNPLKTILWLVTLAEEMPVNEAVEMAAKISRDAKMQLGPVVINAVWPDILGDEGRKEIKQAKVDNDLLRFDRHRVEQSRHYVDKIESQLSGGNFIQLPLVYETKHPKEIAEALIPNFNE